MIRFSLLNGLQIRHPGRPVNFAHLNKPVIKITLTDRRKNDEGQVQTGGILFGRRFEGVRPLSESSRDHLINDVIYLNTEKTRYSKWLSCIIPILESIHSYVNNINTIEGGTHLAGFRRALTLYAQKNNAEDNKMLEKAKSGDFGRFTSREGLIAVISVKVAEPQFEGQDQNEV